VIEAFGAVNDHHQAQNMMPDSKRIEQDVEKQGTWTELVVEARKNWRVMHLFGKLADMVRSEEYFRQRDVVFKTERFESKIAGFMGQTDFESKYRGTRRVSLEDFRATMLELRDRVAADGGQLVMLSMPRMKRVEDESPILVSYSELVAEIAATEKIPLADGRKAFADFVASGKREPRLYVKNSEGVADSYHPSRDGHALLAAALAEAIPVQ
jgi:hypothetical protein